MNLTKKMSLRLRLMLLSGVMLLGLLVLCAVSLQQARNTLLDARKH